MLWRVIAVGQALHLATAFMCSSLNIGTDVKNTKDIVNAGQIQRNGKAAAWGSNPTKKFPPTIAEFYIYVEGLAHLAPEFRVSARQEMEFHHEDEDQEVMHTWVNMNVTEDDEEVGLLDKVTVYKVTQECLDREGGHTLLLNVTFTASTCDPITVNWKKVCGEPSKPSDTFFVGFSKSSKEIAESGVVTAMFDSNTEDDIHRVSYDEDITTLYIYTKNSNTPVYLSPPFGTSYTVIADHEVLYPSLNGSAAAGGWVTSDPMKLDIEYNCIKEKGAKEEIVLILELPYFHDLEVHFFKQCGVNKVKVKKMSWTKAFFL